MSQQMARSQHSFTFDASTQLKDAGLVAATAAAQVGGSDRILDFGNVSPGPQVEQVAYTMAWLVIDVSALERASADEAYDLIYQLSDNASGAGVGFDAGDLVVPKVVVHLGEELGDDADPDADGDIGRIVVGVDNERLGVVFRFARMDTVVAGTVATGINYTAFLAKM